MGDHDLGEPGADGRRGAARLPGGGRGGLRPLGAALYGDRRGDGHGRAACVPRAAIRSARSRRGSSPTRRHATRSSRRRGRSGPSRRYRSVPTCEDALLALLASPNIRSRAWIFERYDHLVGSRTVRRPGLDAAVLRLRPSLRGLAVSLDGPGRIARARAADGRRAGSARGGAERRLRRRRADRVDGLPQLRQPGEAGDRLGARRGDRGNGARGRGAADPGRLRERVALQRDGRPGDPADAGGRLRRARSGRPRRSRPLARGRRRAARIGAEAVGDARVVRVPGALRRARRRAAALDLDAEAPLVAFLWRAGADPVARARRVRRAGSRSRSPRPRSGAVSARRSSCRTTCAPVRRGRRPGGDRVRDAATCRGSAACRCASSASSAARPLFDVPLDELAEAWTAADVRRPRSLRARPRRRPARALRPARAPAPRPGVGRDRRLRPRPPDRAARAGPRHAGLQRAEAERSARRPRDRSHPLLDDRARRSGRTRSRSSSTAALARSRSVTTATSSTPPSCATSCPPTACGWARAPTPR